MNTPNVASLAYVPDAQRIGAQLAQELNIAPRYVEATVRLLDDGATVPFIARYRKELTGGLTDEQLRDLELRLGYLRELEDRRKAIIDSIKEQDKLTVALFDTIMAADTKQRLEDLYAPYRPKRRTRAQIAIEAGLQPLADTLLDEVHAEPEQVAEQFLRDKPFDSIKAVLDGARDILAERFAEDADLRAQLRDYLWQHGWLYAQVVEGKEQEGRNFRDWFDFSEPVKSIPSHRLLAILRGRSQDILRLRLGLEPEKEQQDPYPTVQQIAQFLRLRINLKAPASPREQWLAETCRWTWRVRMLPTFETEIVGSLREQAEQEAIRVFAENLRDLLLAAPAGVKYDLGLDSVIRTRVKLATIDSTARVFAENRLDLLLAAPAGFKNVLGLDPGIRTGVKVAAIDSTARVVATDTIYPFAPRNDKQGSLHTLARLIQDHQIKLVAIGNGTASRETEQQIG